MTDRPEDRVERFLKARQQFLGSNAQRTPIARTHENFRVGNSEIIDLDHEDVAKLVDAVRYLDAENRRAYRRDW